LEGNRLLQTLSRLLLREQAPRSWIIDPRDEMLHYSIWQQFGERTEGLVQYFYSGWLAAGVYEALVKWQRQRQGTEPTILDFASGYGRITRYLLNTLRADQIVVSDIQPEAVAVQREQYGVGGFPSAHEPEALDLAQSFDCLFATSLFTHLPRHRFESWIGQLGRLVTPRGLFVFSVHDEAVLFGGRSMPASGFHFEEMSESEVLAFKEYGSTWVTEAFVAKTLRAHFPHPYSYTRIPRGLWHFQDLYVVSRDAATDFSSLWVPRPPEGYLEECRQVDERTLKLSGWAVSHQASAPPQLRVFLNEELVATARPDGQRARIASPHGQPPGWEVLCSLPAGRTIDPGDSLCVLCEEETGTQGLIHLTTIQGAAFKMAARDHQEQRARSALKVSGLEAKLKECNERLLAEEDLGRRLSARVHAMEASRFWKMRKAWFKLKKGLGLASSERPPGPPVPELDS